MTEKGSGKSNKYIGSIRERNREVASQQPNTPKNKCCLLHLWTDPSILSGKLIFWVFTNGGPPTEHVNYCDASGFLPRRFHITRRHSPGVVQIARPRSAGKQRHPQSGDFLSAQWRADHDPQLLQGWQQWWTTPEDLVTPTLGAWGWSRNVWRLGAPWKCPAGGWVHRTSSDDANMLGWDFQECSRTMRLTRCHWSVLHPTMFFWMSVYHDLYSSLFRVPLQLH